jgi:hypothetical protein
MLANASALSVPVAWPAMSWQSGLADAWGIRRDAIARGES